MSSQAQADRCAVSALEKLSWAYLSRMAAGDTARASVVLSRLAETYARLRPELARRSGVSLASLPATIEPYWGPRTSTLVGALLEQPSLAGMSAAQLGPFFQRTIDPGTTASAAIRDFEAPIAQASMAKLDAQITAALAAHAAATCPPSGVSTSTDKVSPPAQAAAAAAVDLPPVRITATVGSPAFPTWGYWALGALAVGVGFFAYRRYTA